jgi:hypothetical protein
VYTMSPILKNIIINDAAWAKDINITLIIRSIPINNLCFAEVLAVFQ